ncbi:MAG: hypothetical protein FWF81_14140 [Defluviitaleaceae bacterium]|nr:hypothetical protein [Defluviitaleaceae bacterium]
MSKKSKKNKSKASNNQTKTTVKSAPKDEVLSGIKTTTSIRRLDDLLIICSSFLMPGIFLFDLYNRNRAESLILFSHVLILAAVFAAISGLLFFFFKYIVKGIECALILSIVFWLFFWLYQAMLSAVMNIIASLHTIVFLVLLIAILTVATILFRKYSPPLNKMRPVFNILSICIIIFFISNLIPGINHALILNRARNESVFIIGDTYYDEDFDEDFVENVDISLLGERSYNTQLFKTNFVIDPTLPTPDIHWLHLDGMMSLETVERFWNLPPFDEFRDELSNRGFVIYADAMLSAGYTAIAIPALFSPHFYDSFFGELLAQSDTMLRRPRAQFIADEMAQAGMTLRENVRPNLELLAALSARGYTGSFAGPTLRSLPTSFDYIHADYTYVATATSDASLSILDLKRLLSLTTPIDLTPPPDNQTAYENDIDNEISSNGAMPLFRFRNLQYTHMIRVWRHDPELTERDNTAINSYIFAFEHMINRILYRVDSILASNPNAVIVLQSDHGFHIHETQQFLLDQNYPLEQVLELMNSVFSAVRIPEQYGGLDEPLAPLNISRELVNRFVGENYRLLP